jgi:hypothetical protein
MFFLVEKKDGSPIIVAGPCWPFCTFVTVPLIVVLSGLVGYFIVSNPSSGLVSESFRCLLINVVDASQLTSFNLPVLGMFLAVVVCPDILSNISIRPCCIILCKL